VYARYNTNLSRVDYRGTNLYTDILAHVRDWQICASLDGTGATGEYIRTGLDYPSWLANFEQGIKHMRHPRQMRIDFTLTLPGMFEVEAIQQLAAQLGVQTLAKVIFSFSPDIVMSPLALPRQLLEPWINELVPQTSGAMQDTLVQLRKRPTFEEQWPDRWQQGLKQGKNRLLKLEALRTAPTDIASILSARPDIARWWNDI
jgi:hypothetical protein